MIGRIVKTYSEFYYVKSGDELYTCKARGLFKKNRIKPLVGDLVQLSPVEDKDVNGKITDILPRATELLRPSVANVSMAVVVFSATLPKPKFSQIDKCLIETEKTGIEVLLCFNKSDTADEKERSDLAEVYADSGYRTLFTSTASGEGLGELRELIRDKIVVLTGPSGVGKSSLINVLSGGNMVTGELSAKTNRGKQTTRHYELIAVDPTTMLLDSPGFTSLYLKSCDYYELKDDYPEFRNRASGCKFKNKCLHVSEPDCAVKDAVREGKISSKRYEAYLELLEELKKQR